MIIVRCIAALLVLVALTVLIGKGQDPSPNAEVSRYLEFLREEQNELDFQLRNKEITRPFYLRAGQRLKILKDLVIKYGRANPDGPLPEYYVVIAAEVNNLIPDGQKKLKGARPGKIIDGNWKYLRTVVQGGSFYVLERVAGSSDKNDKDDKEAMPQPASSEELMSELCAVPNDNLEREKETAKLFIQAGAKPDEIKYQKLDDSDAQNVYVVKPGLTQKIIVVGGHIDHVKAGRGIIDDWSGVCAVTNIYQAIKQIKTKHTIIFIGFVGEESGLLGSKCYVRNLTSEALAEHKAMLNLECLGPAESHIWVNGSDKDLAARLRAAAAEAKLPVHDHELYGVGADSNPFREKSIPAITLDGLPEEKFSLIHSDKDQCENVNHNYYYDSYRLAIAYLLALDKSL